MSDSDRTPLPVNRVNSEALAELLVPIYTAIYGEAPPATFYVEPLVMAEAKTERGVEHCIIGIEGVGWATTSANVFNVPVNSGMITVPIYWERVPLRDTQADLAQFIRVFGSRLESNWWRWDSSIRKARGI